MQMKHYAGSSRVATNEMQFDLEKGSLVVLVSRGWLCSIRVTNERKFPALLERLRRTFICHPQGCIIRSENEQLFLVSATGEETIAVITEKEKLWYRVYYTRPSAETNFICHKLDRSEMTVTSNIKGPVQGVDFEARKKELHIFKERSTAYSLALKNGKETSFRPGVEQTDHFRAFTYGHSSAPHKIPWQTNRDLELRRDKDGIHLTSRRGKRKTESSVLGTMSAELVDYMLLFVAPIIQPRVRYFGAIKCAIFIVDDPKQLDTFNATGTGCTFDKNIRMFMEYSKDLTRWASRLTVVKEESAETATVMQRNILMPYQQSQLFMDVDEKDFPIKLKISFERGSFNAVHVKENEVHYKISQKDDNSCTLKFGKKRIEQDAEEEIYSLPIASIINRSVITQVY
uniref:Uncharacterized protein n=1 Tax=Parascaris univalens TaxID=6257 RepID=A0A914ZNQ0_PARUN